MKRDERILELQEKSLELAKKIFEQVEVFCKENPDVTPARFMEFLQKIFFLYREHKRLEREGEILSSRLLLTSADFLRVMAESCSALGFHMLESEISTSSQGGTQ
jgi:hypothetical protein